MAVGYTAGACTPGDYTRPGSADEEQDQEVGAGSTADLAAVESGWSQVPKLGVCTAGIGVA